MTVLIDALWYDRSVSYYGITSFCLLTNIIFSGSTSKKILCFLNLTRKCKWRKTVTKLFKFYQQKAQVAWADFLLIAIPVYQFLDKRFQNIKHRKLEIPWRISRIRKFSVHYPWQVSTATLACCRVRFEVFSSFIGTFLALSWTSNAGIQITAWCVTNTSL